MLHTVIFLLQCLTSYQKKSIEKRGRECGYPAVWKAFKNKTVVKLKKNHDSGHRIRVRVHLGGYFHTCSQLT